MTTIQGNLAAMAKELEEAQDKSDKLTRKGGKASTQKVESAASKLQSANQQWESQSPFIFETLQALDETRLNHLRDVLTQYETHEADQIERNRITVEQTLSSLLEIDTSQEIKNWSQAAVAGRSMTERSARQLSNAGSSVAGGSFGGTNAAPPPPQTPRSTHTDNESEHSGKHEEKSGKLMIISIHSSGYSCFLFWRASKCVSCAKFNIYFRVQVREEPIWNNAQSTASKCPWRIRSSTITLQKWQHWISYFWTELREQRWAAKSISPYLVE